MKLPTFFIIGAPKCGTTALSEYLRAHPQVFFSDPKEPHYFNTDFSCRHTSSWDVYQSYFRHADEHHAAVGEGSVFYLRSTEAVPNILRINAKARFIVMIRNPVEAVISWHSEVLYAHGEDVVDLEEAWRLQEERSQGRHLPSLNNVREALQYGEMYRLGSQLARLYTRASKDQVLVLLTEDLAEDSRSCYRKVLEFLDLRDDGRTEFPRINERKKLRSRVLATFISRLAEARKRLGLKNLGFGIAEKLRWLNTAQDQRPKVTPRIRSLLESYFASEVVQLESLLGRDLTSWKAGHGTLQAEATRGVPPPSKP